MNDDPAHDNLGMLAAVQIDLDQEPEILSLRPGRLADYVGQGEIVETLKIAIDAALQRREQIGRASCRERV